MLEVKRLSISYGDAKIVERVSFSVKKKETVCIVGESGSGKTTVLRGILGLLGENGRVTEGEILFKGRDLISLTGDEYRRFRGKQIAMVYQQAGRSMDPVTKIGKQFHEMLCTKERISRSESDEIAAFYLNKLFMKEPRQILRSYPPMLSGGTNQRVAIALALAMEPELILADEPTSALDVTVQVEVVKALQQAKELSGAGILMVTHNMGVVARLADQVGVMYAGQMVEWGGREQILRRPSHPYTKMLLNSVLGMDGKIPEIAYTGQKREEEGKCPYFSMCREKDKKCFVCEPEWTEIEENHFMLCNL